MTEHDPIDQLMDRWTDSQASDLEATSDQLCVDYPHLRPELEKRIRAVRAIDALRLPRDATPTVTGATDTHAPGGPAGAPIAFAPARRPDELGRLGDYRILKRLGEGGMGAVFLAEHDGLKRFDALKVMKPESAASPQAKDRFLREARAAASVKHDHVVTIYHVGEDHGVPFIAMELLEGESLDERLKRVPPLTPTDAARIGHAIAAGLAAAHARGLIHRDVKPGNVWLETGSPPRVKLLDFGLARPLADDVQITHAGTIVGSPAYMSPEQAAGLDLDGRSDLFSLGVVMYRMTTGKLPFHGSNVLAILRQVDTHQPPPPHAVNPAVPQSLSEMIMRLLSKSPADRPASAAEVARVLERIVQGTAPDGGMTQEYAAPARPAPRPRRGLALAIVAAALMLPLLLGTGLVLLVAFGGLIILTPSTQNRGGPGPDDVSVVTAAHPALEPLKGWIDIRVWPNQLALGSGRRVNRIESVPLKFGEWMHIEAQLNRPAYMYVVWLDTEGNASPLYPWTKDGDWTSWPQMEEKRRSLSLPEMVDGVKTATGIIELQKGSPGVESLLLLVREDPLPRNFDPNVIFAGLPRQHGGDVAVAAWFENGELVRDEVDRSPPKRQFAVEGEDPILKTQALLRTRLKEIFPYTRAVSFGTKDGR